MGCGNDSIEVDPAESPTQAVHVCHMILQMGQGVVNLILFICIDMANTSALEIRHCYLQIIQTRISIRIANLINAPKREDEISIRFCSMLYLATMLWPWDLLVQNLVQVYLVISKRYKTTPNRHQPEKSRFYFFITYTDDLYTDT